MTLEDGAARERIRTDTATTLFVEAGAGSGKTSELVQRIARLVLHDGVPLRHIVAVTFTEKAAAELRDRLREAFDHAQSKDLLAGADAARAALGDLDSAAIGTLHAFAQRILTEHPIQAGIPPLIEVLDEVGSSVAFAERWTGLQADLLGDDAIEQPLLIGMSLGIRLADVRSLALLLGRDWDLIADRVLAKDELPFAVGDMAPLVMQGRIAADFRHVCTDSNDTLRPKFVELSNALDRFDSAPDDEGRLAELQTIAKLTFPSNKGKKENWGGRKPEALEAGRAIVDAAQQVVATVTTACLRHLTRWIGEKVLAAASDRRDEGRLEFHDLLVLSRTLLREHPDVRQALHDRYQRLLLDEFQDTDPIQIELAVRIAGGAGADADDWEGVTVPPGRLFVVGDPKQSIYRFRRASIATYLEARQRIGTAVSLTTNFRTVPPILDRIDDIFGALIKEEPKQQPAFVPLAPFRDSSDDAGPAFTVLGGQAHEKKTLAPAVRGAEAQDVALTIARIQSEAWQVFDGSKKMWRTARLSDVAVLLPSRTSLPDLQEALDAAGIPYRTESSSLVYAEQEVRDLLAGARAVADPSDAFALVTVLRSSLFGCGDDDLWQFKQLRGSSFNIFAPRSDEMAATRVGAALDALRDLARRAQWLRPSEVLTALVADRRMYEAYADDERARDVWRRLRFVIDQARAWSEVSNGGLRAYLAWAALQGAETSRVAEAVLPETDQDSVRVMTVHAAKGLEFPIVIMSGMSAQPYNRRGVVLLWTHDGYAVKTSGATQTDEFDAARTADEQMSEAEKKRLLYVAATRARDHLVISLHRAEGDEKSSAGLIASALPPSFLEPKAEADVPVFRAAEASTSAAPPDFDAWRERIDAARAGARVKPAVSASGLEGTEPELELAEPSEEERGRAKGQRDLELPPWSKGRYGSAVGRAVHGVLQVVDLAGGSKSAAFASAVGAQAVAEGVTDQIDMVHALAASALASDVVQRAAARDHWRESYVGTVDEDEAVVEGFVDLLYREDDGSLVVVDYKTDAVPAAGIPSRVAYYRPQIQAYLRGVRDATDLPVSGRLLFLHPTKAVEERVS